MHFKFENYFNNQDNRDCINETFVQPQIVADFSTFKSILKQLLYLEDVDLNVFGNYLYYTFFASDDSEGELDFDIVDITAMLAELKDFDIYQDILSELNKIVDDPDFYLEIPFEMNLGADEVDLDAQDSMSEAKINIMTAKTANKKKRKFFTISKAQLLRNKPKNKIKNRENRAKNRAYKRANAAKIKRYQISRQRLIDKGLHHVKLRRKA